MLLHPQTKESKDALTFIEYSNLISGNNFFSDIRPLNRRQIAIGLHQLQSIVPGDQVSQQRLEYYFSEYYAERINLEDLADTSSGLLSFVDSSRFYIYSYFSRDFSFTVNPEIRVAYDPIESHYYQFGGLNILGSVGENLSYWFNFRDNIETGSNLDKKKQFTSETGINVLRSSSNLIDYSETRGGFIYDWSWGNVTLAKDFLHIGSSFQSSVIISDKAPSFPFLRIEASPVDWLRYNFIHAWLDSDLIDSATIRSTDVGSLVLRRNRTYSRLQKYYVAHTFSFNPFPNFWMTFGESIVYGDELEYVYFLPVFYRLADHYNTIGGGDSGDNAQLFLNYSYVWPSIRAKLYLSFYLDEFSPSDLFSGGDNAQVFSLMAGTRFINPLLENNLITLEYSAVRPYVGVNADPLHTYKSSGYDLGHWIGTNAVQFYFESLFYLPYMIDVRLNYTYVIKGAKENLDDYYNRVKETYPLLYGAKSNYSEFGIEIEYSPFKDLFFETKANCINVAGGRFESEYNKKTGVSFVTGVRYGFQ